MEPQNREQRRHPEKLEEDPAMRPQEDPHSSQHDLATAASQDVESARAKSSGHGKKTADKWNQ